VILQKNHVLAQLTVSGEGLKIFDFFSELGFFFLPTCRAMALPTTLQGRPFGPQQLAQVQALLKRLVQRRSHRWREDLQTRLQRVQQHPEQNMGFIEENIRQSALELQRLLVQKAMQDKADAVDEKCPDCQRPLCHKKRRVEKVVDASLYFFRNRARGLFHRVPNHLLELFDPFIKSG